MVPGKPIRILTATKSSNRSTMAMNRCLASCRNWKSSAWVPAVQNLRVIAEENRAEVNFELVERLAEREERDWTYFGRLRHERKRSFEIRKMC